MLLIRATPFDSLNAKAYDASAQKKANPIAAASTATLATVLCSMTNIAAAPVNTGGLVIVAEGVTVGLLLVVFLVLDNEDEEEGGGLITEEEDGRSVTVVIIVMSLTMVVKVVQVGVGLIVVELVTGGGTMDTTVEVEHFVQAELEL